MPNLKKKIERLKDVLNSTLIFLNGMNDKNFQFNLKRASELMQNAHELKKELKEGYRIEEIKLFEQDLSVIAKQVSDKFDNIITNKRLELEIVSKKIILAQNQKKLLNYSR